MPGIDLAKSVVQLHRAAPGRAPSNMSRETGSGRFKPAGADMSDDGTDSLIEVEMRAAAGAASQGERSGVFGVFMCRVRMYFSTLLSWRKQHPQILRRVYQANPLRFKGCILHAARAAHPSVKELPAGDRLTRIRRMLECFSSISVFAESDMFHSMEFSAGDASL